MRLSSLSIFFSITLFACRDKNLAGTWQDQCSTSFNQGKKCEGSLTWELYPNGIYRETFASNSGKLTSEGKWSTSGGILEVEILEQGIKEKHMQAIRKIEKYKYSVTKNVLTSGQDLETDSQFHTEHIETKTYDSTGYSKVRRDPANQGYKDTFVRLSVFEK